MAGRFRMGSPEFLCLDEPCGSRMRKALRQMVGAPLRSLLRQISGLEPYQDTIQNRMTARLRFSLALAQAHKPVGQILDVGCSSGWFEHWAGHLSDLSVTAVEPSAAALERAKMNAPSASYYRASALELPFRDGSFDGAVMFEVIEHVPLGTERLALREARRVLRKGAWFLLSTPHAHPLAMLLDPAWYFGHRHYSRRAIERLVRDAGFTVVNILVRGGTWELFNTLWLYIFKWFFDAEPPLKTAIERRLDREFFVKGVGMTNVFIEAVADS